MKIKHVALFVGALLLSGCYTVNFRGVEAAGSPAGQSFHQWTHSLFWGLVPLGKVNIDQCGAAGVKRMKSQIGGLGLLGYALTGGIWTPMHVKIVCGQANAGLAGDGAPVADDWFAEH